MALEDEEEKVHGSENGDYAHGNFDQPGIDFLRADSQEKEADRETDEDCCESVE